MPELIDRYSRRIDYMRISITDRCNLRCRYCMPNNGIRPMPREEILSYEEILRIVRIAAVYGVKKVRVTGGEPLIRKGVIKFLGQLHQVPFIEDITLTTNGVLLASSVNDLAMAGIKRINISLDTLKVERFAFITRRDTFPQVMEGIKAVEKASFFPIKINCVAVKGFNDDEIMNFAELTLTHPYYVRFIEFMPLGEGDYWKTGKTIPGHEIMEIIKRQYPLNPVSSDKDQRGTARRFTIPGALGELGFISPLSSHFCEYCNRIRLTPDGRLRNCLFSDQEIDIKSAMRSGADDGQLEMLLKESIHQKPSGHQLHEDPSHTCKRSMWRIGG